MNEEDSLQANVEHLTKTKDATTAPLGLSTGHLARHFSVRTVYHSDRYAGRSQQRTSLERTWLEGTMDRAICGQPSAPDKSDMPYVGDTSDRRFDSPVRREHVHSLVVGLCAGAIPFGMDTAVHWARVRAQRA
jgi:hypothetical protein